jgi:hypothetical protein
MTVAAIKKPGMDRYRVFAYSDELFVHHVHRYFKTETHFSCSWFSPHHDLLFLFHRTDPMSGSCACIIGRLFQNPAIADHEQGLGKFMKAASCK